MRIISVKNLTKKFKDLKAANNIRFDVNPGEVFAFLGPNGAGKTTTIKMLTTLLEPSSGNITVNGFEIHDRMNVRKSFGIVFQDSSIDDELTAYENMEFNEAEVKYMDELRYYRNGTKYYGTILNLTYAEKTLEFLNKIHPKLMKIVRKLD